MSVSELKYLGVVLCATVSLGIGPSAHALIGGVELGGLTDHLFVFTDGNVDANWQSSSKGYVGDVAVNGILADERTSGDVAYAGKIYTSDNSLGAWQDIVDNNPGQASTATNEIARLNALAFDLDNAFAQVNALTPSAGFASVSSTALNGLNTQNGVADTVVVNVTSDFQVSSEINIIGDADDAYILRWDDDADPSNGYNGTVKFQSGGAIVPLGDLTPGNFVHVAGNLNASGGGGPPAPPYPQGAVDENGVLIAGGDDFSGGGYFTGYWLTTGDPSDGETDSFSNAVFVGGWYTSTTKFSLTSGSSGIRQEPIPEPASLAVLAIGGLATLRRRRVA